ncbi:MAG: tripartite tricarboxylate transporter substrate-binding protein [Desulfobacterales bacterium]|nr:tripartite tricarboxylate transporter substrate-binding protein [Desulfobacterales bacterium]
MRKLTLIISLVLMMTLTVASASYAKPFYDGKVITIIVTTKPGGGYDWYGRLVAQYMKKYLPGSTFIVKNIPGGGHIIGVNTLYKAKPDGLTLGTFNRAVGLTQVVGSKGVKFDFAKLSWLGSPCSELYAYIVNPKMFKNIDEVLKADKIRLAAEGLGAVSYVNPLMMYQALEKDNFQISTGYSGAEMEMALIRGEADGIWGSVGSRMALFESGDGRAVVLVGRQKPEQLKDVPFIEEVLTKPEQKPVAKLLRGIQLVGRPFAAPPGMPEDRLKILREAFEKACKDPEAVALAQKADKPMDFVDAKEVEDWAKGHFELSPNIVAKLKEAYGMK